MTTKEPKLISLKEAAEISGYAPDYIGQLIRKGKIPGKQVYCNVQWMTTREAILEYLKKDRKERKPETIQKKAVEFARRLKIKILEKSKPDRLLSFSLYFIVAFSILFSLLLFYIVSVNIEKKIEKKALEKAYQLQIKENE